MWNMIFRIRDQHGNNFFYYDVAVAVVGYVNILSLTLCHTHSLPTSRPQYLIESHKMKMKFDINTRNTCCHSRMCELSAI